MGQVLMFSVFCYVGFSLVKAPLLIKISISITFTVKKVHLNVSLPEVIWGNVLT